jgi:hypothetical protein
MPEDGKQEQKSCAFCEDTRHDLETCKKFEKLTVDERVKVIKEKRLCFRCFKGNHQSKQCQSHVVCKMCDKRHPTLLHHDTPRGTDTSNERQKTPVQPKVSAICVSDK